MKSVIEVTALWDDGVNRSTQKRRYLSSCPPDVETAARAVRRHWGVENSLHWVLDVTFRENESPIRRGNGAEVMSVLRRLTLNLLKRNTAAKASMKFKHRTAAMDDSTY